MNFFKPKKIPAKIVKFVYMAYKWGYSDKEMGLEMKTKEEIKDSMQKGYSKGLNKEKH